MAATGGFRALSCIELLSYRGNDDMQPFRSLGVQHLVLADCKGLERKLLVPGAFEALQSLHIEEPVFTSHCENWEDSDAAHRSFDEILSTWDGMLSLPQLGQLSGSCKLFEIGMEVDPRMLKKVEYRSRTVEAEFEVPYPMLPFKMWVRQTD